MSNMQNRKSSRPAGSGFVRKRTYTRKKVCRFCADESLKIDYKDSRLMRNFVSERGKIMPRRITGNCAYHQRRVSKAIKIARIVSLMPYTAVNI